jgi:hypothetical protein
MSSQTPEDRRSLDEAGAPESEMLEAAARTGDPARQPGDGQGGQPAQPDEADLALARGRAETAGQLNVQLEELRSAFLQVLDSFALDVTGRISRVELLVRERSASEKTPRRLDADLDDMRDLLADLKVKPGKGRRRDLKRIQGLVQALEDVVDGWE